MKRILLVGAGHAHLVLLRELAEVPLHGARITLVSPASRQIYSGMLPGLVAGHYRLDETEIDVAALCARAYVEFVPGRIAALDAAARRAKLEDGSELAYDLVSLNAGSLVQRSIAGAEHALALKPFETFVSRLSKARPERIAIVGAGVSGCELAMALRYRGAAVTLFSEKSALPPELVGRTAQALRRAGVDFRPGMAVTTIEPGPVIIAGPSRQDFHMVLLATGPAPLPWLRGSGLALDEAGFVLVADTLQSVSHPEVFACGDCATERAPSLQRPVPKSGVYAVRQGARLVQNLRNLFAGAPLEPFVPQRHALILLSCGSRYAIAQRGGWTSEGRWVWRWKDLIDRRWLRSLRN